MKSESNTILDTDKTDNSSKESNYDFWEDYYNLHMNKEENKEEDVASNDDDKQSTSDSNTAITVSSIDSDNQENGKSDEIKNQDDIEKTSKIKPRINKSKNKKPFLKSIIKRFNSYSLYWILTSLFTFCSLLVAAYILSYHSVPEKTPNSSEAILTKTYFGSYILIDPQDTKRSKELLDKGYLGVGISNLLYKLIKPGQIVIDVGAEFGYYTLYLAELVGPSGRVFSFESNKKASSLLEKSIKLNNISNVSLYNDLVYSSDSSVLVENKANSSRIFLDQSKIENTDNVEIVNTITLDKQLNKIHNVSLLYINTTKNNLNVIYGAKNLIARSRNIKIITIWSGVDKKAKEIERVFNDFAHLDFKFWLINDDITLTEINDYRVLLGENHINIIIAKKNPLIL